MTNEEIKNILRLHKMWLDGVYEGERANLSGADLRGSDLRSANLRGANLLDANLIGAYLNGADLRGVNLRSSNLRGTDLRYSDLGSADLDFSEFPLWCGGLHIHIDDRQAIQLLYHLVNNVLFSKNTSQELKKMLSNPDLLKKANEFHRVQECGMLKPYDKNASQEE